MEDARKRPEETARPQPKTQRGRDTRDEILRAARTLASERWIDEVPFVELAAKADVARGSLLHAFRDWHTVLYDLFSAEIDRLDESFTAAVALKRVRPADRVSAMLCPLLDRAEQTGLLYPNLRGAMFAWQGELTEADESEESMSLPPSRAMLGAFSRIQLREHYAAIEELLEVPCVASPEPRRFPNVPIGECLLHFTLDLAAGIPSHWATLKTL